MLIRDKKDLEVAYELLAIIKASKRAPEAKEKHLRDIKKDIREYTHRAPDTARVIHDGGYGSWIELMELPEELETKEEAAEYFEENCWRHYTPTYYDCTGQIFTQWYKLVQRRGRWMAYHSLGMDV